MILEACVENYQDAILASQKGANRIELCENLAVGGTTPSYGTIKLCQQNLKIPLAVMIRPRGGNFTYTDDEILIMQEDIRICKEIGVQGVVFGLLTTDNQIDYEKTKELILRAKPMKVVFHKAFDEINNPIEAMEQLIQLGVDRILTSGAKPTAIEGQELLRSLISKAAGRIEIVVAGKVTFENIKELQGLIPATEFHGKKIAG